MHGIREAIDDEMHFYFVQYMIRGLPRNIGKRWAPENITIAPNETQSRESRTYLTIVT
jgi:hypothetical protein